jgi:hypothetical protein
MIHEFVTPTIDFTGVSSPKLNFKLAFAQRTSADADNLRVYASIDCGKTWTLRYSKSGTSLSTTSGVVTSSFNPSAAQWRQESINLSAYAGQDNVRFKFQFAYKGGNNILVDDINFGLTTTSVNDMSRDIALSVFPNPVANNQIAVSFNLQENSTISATMYAVDGRETTLLTNQELKAGHQLLQLPVGNLPAGTYILNIRDERNNNYSKQVIVR